MPADFSRDPSADHLGLNADQLALRERARELAVGTMAPRAVSVDQTEQYPWENVHALRDAGFMGMTIPTEYGGPGMDFVDAVIVIEEMARVCGVTGRVTVESNMGAISAVMAYGTETQKRMAADFVLSGDKPAICITEPEAGSAATDMTTTAVRRPGGYVINGAKHWITGGGVSRLHLIFARVIDEKGEEQGIGGFLAVRDETQGLRVGEREPTMGLRGIPEARLYFEDMFVADDMVLLPPSGFRRGFADLMNAYNSQRVGAGTMALGIAAGATDIARDFLLEREQFGRPIAEFQGLQWMLADMYTQVQAARLMLHSAARSRGPDASAFPDPYVAAQAKLFTSEMGVRVTNDALQLHGAWGYSRNNPIERMVRDARMFTIGGGTAQVLRTVISSRALGIKTPQTRDGYLKLAEKQAAGNASLPRAGSGNN